MDRKRGNLIYLLSALYEKKSPLKSGLKWQSKNLNFLKAERNMIQDFIYTYLVMTALWKIDKRF